MHAIETTYNGTTFRSRTEARFAMALDRMGSRWQYEPEGFDFGVRYLPDFWVSDIVVLGGTGAWIEIKPEFPDVVATLLCPMLAKATHRPVIMYLWNDHLGITSSPEGLTAEVTSGRLAGCVNCGRVHLLDGDRGDCFVCGTARSVRRSVASRILDEVTAHRFWNPRRST